MRDDLIQGIVFSRSDIVDLRRLSRRERMVFKMLATKRSLRKFNYAGPRLHVKRQAFVAVRGDKNRQSDLQALSDRLKSA